MLKDVMESQALLYVGPMIKHASDASSRSPKMRNSFNRVVFDSLKSLLRVQEILMAQTMHFVLVVLHDSEGRCRYRVR